MAPITPTSTFADISHYQTVDLAAYKAAGYRWICMKVSGGANDGTLRFADSVDMPGRWRQAGQLGLYRIGYHFARNNNSGADEFDWFMSLIDAAGGMAAQDAIWYDQEDNRTAATIDLARQRTREFVGRAVARGHTTGQIYSGKWFLEPARIVAADLPPGWRQLCISDYTAGQPDDQIEVPSGWAREQIVARQYTDAANLPGIPATDADRILHAWLTEGLTMADAQDILDAIAAMTRLILRGELGTPPVEDPAHHGYSLLGVRERLDALLAAQAVQIQGLTTAFAQFVAAGTNDLTTDEVEAALRTALDEALVHVAITVGGQTPPASA